MSNEPQANDPAEMIHFRAVDCTETVPLLVTFKIGGMDTRTLITRQQLEELYTERKITCFRKPR